MSANRIDLNCDLGEGNGDASQAIDRELLGIVTSANIACGGHAGDERSMLGTVRAAMACGVAIGAHPSYPDRVGFGRVEMPMTPEQIEASVLEQVAALDRIVRSVGGELRHVKPHGALYHAAMTKRPVAEAIARAAGRVRSGLTLVGLAGAPGLDVWRSLACPVAAEAFADRRYEPDGTLRARTREGALLASPADAAAQAVSIACDRRVTAADGSLVVIDAATICIHGDTPNAVEFARAVRAALESTGVAVRPL